MRCFLFFVWRFRCCRRRRWCLLTWCYLSKDGEDVPVVHAHGGEVARSVGHLPVSSLVHKVKGVEVEQGCFHYRQVRSSKKNWLVDVKYVNFSFFQKKILNYWSEWSSLKAGTDFGSWEIPTDELIVCSFLSRLWRRFIERPRFSFSCVAVHLLQVQIRASLSHGGS